jgi:hypothetical protein
MNFVYQGGTALFQIIQGYVPSTFTDRHNIPDTYQSYGIPKIPASLPWSITAMVYQGIILSGNPTLLAKKWSIVIGTAVGTYLSDVNLNTDLKTKHKIFIINQVANITLGVVSLAYGHYIFGISAIIFSGNQLISALYIF